MERELNELDLPQDREALKTLKAQTIRKVASQAAWELFEALSSLERNDLLARFALTRQDIDRLVKLLETAARQSERNEATENSE